VLADLKTVVSEACPNVVRYADGENVEGLLEVEIHPGKGQLTVFVRDLGDGISPRPDSDITTMKLGRRSIGVLSNRMRLTSVLGRGTELEAEIPICDPACDDRVSRGLP
jgi:signal transduction histidine kinase